MLTKKIKHINKKLTSMVAIMLLLILATMPVNALTNSNTTTTAQRNHIAKNWTYSSRGYAEQNCLSYAINKGNVWTWPWGSSNPTKAQAKTYLSGQGYKYSLDANVAGPLPGAEVYAYALNGGITHFAKAVSGGPVRAKWGSCEFFNHSTSNPYTNNVYGPLSFRFSK